MITSSAMPSPAGATASDRRGHLRSAESGEFAMTLSDFNRVRTLIYEHAGITLSEGKRAMVYSRLSRRLREVHHASFASYLDWLAALTGAAANGEWQQFVNCLTTNLTAFFREEHHFRVLEQELKARRNAPIRVWCNAASTGEEPYSLAMTVVEALGQHADVKIVASDIDTKVLTTAGLGIYDSDSRGLGTAQLKQHFLNGKGANTGSIRVKPQVARLVEFRQFNLMDERWAIGDPFDFVFCRNVMIYFDKATQRQVLERMHRVIKPGGLLFAGHSENFGDSRDLFRLRAQTVYVRS